MASNYAGFNVNYETSPGLILSVSANPTAVASATDVDIAGDKITKTAHGRNNGDILLYTAGSGAIGGLTNGNYYYVVNKTTNDFQLSATLGGSAINLTSIGTGTQTFTRAIEVKIRAEGAASDAAESPLKTDASGDIALGSLAAIAAASVVHFRVENFNGMAFSVSQITT
jgi:hypothetical protein